MEILEGVALAPHTTLGLGGPARWYLVAKDEETLIRGLEWARERSLPVGLLGGGSNLVIADEGFDGLVIELAMRGVEERVEGDRVLITAQAGEPWDPLVARTVASNLGGLECLSGIPGRVGATPIQNVGAYGQEVGERLHAVRVFDRRQRLVRDMTPDECELGYRDSLFKRQPELYVVLAVTFALTPNGAATIRYAELERALGDDRSLQTVRDTVLTLRRRKSMVLDPADPNSRSAGSFFTNPIVSSEQAKAVIDLAVREGLVASEDQVPRWPVGDKVKLAAGWLIERAGIQKGLRRGPVGVSSRHALALVHHGGGTTAQLMALAEEIRQVVETRFGVALVPEPVRWGPRARPG